MYPCGKATRPGRGPDGPPPRGARGVTNSSAPFSSSAASGPRPPGRGRVPRRAIPHQHITELGRQDGHPCGAPVPPDRLHHVHPAAREQLRRLRGRLARGRVPVKIAVKPYAVRRVDVDAAATSADSRCLNLILIGSPLTCGIFSRAVVDGSTYGTVETRLPSYHWGFVTVDAKPSRHSSLASLEDVGDIPPSVFALFLWIKVRHQSSPTSRSADSRCLNLILIGAPRHSQMS